MRDWSEVTCPTCGEVGSLADPEGGEAKCKACGFRVKVERVPVEEYFGG